MNNTQTQKKNKKQSNSFKKCDLNQISRKLKFGVLTSKNFFARFFARMRLVYFGGWTILLEKSSIIDSKQP